MLPPVTRTGSSAVLKTMIVRTPRMTARISVTFGLRPMVSLRSQLTFCSGAVFTCGLKGGYEAGVKLVSGLKLFSHLANIGDTRSLVIHPPSTTHQQLSADQQKAAGVTPDMVRLSIGIEDLDDILWDLDQALRTATA